MSGLVSGIVGMRPPAPALPAVYAYEAADIANVTGNGTVYAVSLDTEVFDQHSDFASDTFTAPVTGQYFVAFRVRFSGHTTDMNDAHVRVITSNNTFNVIYGSRDIGTWCIVGSSLVDMDRNDTVSISFVVGGVGSDAVDLGTTARGTAMSVHLVA